MSARGHDDVVIFAERLLALLDRGSFTATYKYAVLLGLIDLCFEHAGRHGEPPTSLTTRQLAEKVIELYWPQARPYADDRVLEQNSGPRQAKIVSDILKFREVSGDPTLSLHRARTEPWLTSRFNALVQSVEWTLIEMPLPRLQVIGVGADPFIYQVSWTRESVKRRKVTRRAVLSGQDFDNSIRFIGSAASHLVRLAGVLRPVLHREWAAKVAQLNDLPAARLEDFLFGVQRQAVGALVADLRDLQRGRCFYCDEAVTSRPQVDHFMPWARHPDDAIENLVVAHAGCNGSKSDHLAAAAHVGRWRARAFEHASDLCDIARSHRWESGGEATASTARAIYLNLASGIPLWKGRDCFEPADRNALMAAFLGG